MTVTYRHKKALKNVGKSRTEAEALEKADYSPSYAKSGNIKKTKGWQALLEKTLPDKLLVKVHMEGLNATKRQGVGGMVIGVEDGEVTKMGHTDIEVPDYPTRHKYLDTAYKIKGKLSDKPELVVPEIKISFNGMKNDSK